MHRKTDDHGAVSRPRCYVVRRAFFARIRVFLSTQADALTGFCRRTAMRNGSAASACEPRSSPNDSSARLFQRVTYGCVVLSTSSERPWRPWGSVEGRLPKARRPRSPRPPTDGCARHGWLAATRDLQIATEEDARPDKVNAGCLCKARAGADAVSIARAYGSRSTR